MAWLIKRNGLYYDGEGNWYSHRARIYDKYPVVNLDDIDIINIPTPNKEE